MPSEVGILFQLQGVAGQISKWRHATLTSEESAWNVFPALLVVSENVSGRSIIAANIRRISSPRACCFHPNFLHRRGRD